jgi:hypothetical protein
MTTFPGVVTLNDDSVPVMVGLHDDKISLVSGEVSIGEWLSGQYEVIDLGSGTFVIEAEHDSFSFHPDDPHGFARGISREQESEPERAPAPVRSLDTIEIKEGPPPQRATLVAFYTLTAVTAALGIWALISLFT